MDEIMFKFRSGNKIGKSSKFDIRSALKVHFAGSASVLFEGRFLKRPLWEQTVNATRRYQDNPKRVGPSRSEKRPRKIDTSGGGTITRVTQAVSGGRHDGFKYFRSEARAPPCPVPCGIVEIALPFSRSFSLSLSSRISLAVYAVHCA